MAHKQNPVSLRRPRKNPARHLTARRSCACHLGPRSKSVLIEKKWGAPIVCNDGLTIAKEFDLKNPEEKSWRSHAPPGGRKDR